MHHFATISWLAVLVAALSGFVIGSLWYGPLFQKPWMQLTGMTKEKGAQVSPVFTFGLAYVLNVIAAIGLSLIIGPSHNWLLGAHTGLAAGCFFAATAIGIIYLFEQKPLKLFLINAVYQIVNFTAIGAVIGAWR
jgi:Protein of unknown function (DUF1761)